ncbi:MAG: FtsX-like permease family protein, partial [Bacteroidetes bacterium]
MSAIVLGIAALVAINSFNYNLQRDIDEQAASLLGADLAISGNRAMGDSLAALVAELPVAQSARKLEMFSMSYFPRVDHSQFVRLQALEGNFPFYGELKTEPAQAIATLRTQGGIALVDQGLLQQHELRVGDSIRIGRTLFPIGGALLNDFASADIASGFAPPVYIALGDLQATGLVQTGSLINYDYYYALPANYAVEEWADEQEDTFREQGLSIQTVQGQKERLSEAFSGLNAFLNLVALVSLLLGCIGVASSVLIYIKTKIASIAVFRCLGMSGRAVFMIYLLQIVGLGALSVGLGVVLGTAVQLILPVLFKDFLPLEVTTQVAWSAIAEGWVVGLLFTGLFALVPLLPVRRISPLRILRASYEADTRQRDYRLWGVYVTIGLSLFGFLWYLTAELLAAVFFCVGLALAFGLLFAVAKAIVWLIRRYFPRSWNFVFRQGLANLFRPNNQTATLLVSIGLGTAILTTLFVIQGLLLANVAQMDA